MRDAAYFIGGALPVEERRAHEESLLRAYHDELLAHGVAGFSWEQCWEEYRRQCFLLLVMTIAPAMVVERTERGDDMFMAVFGRAAQMAIDLNATSSCPSRTRGERRRCDRSPPTRARTSPAPRSSGTRAGTSTRSATTEGSASTTGSGGCPTRTPAWSPPASSAPASRRSCWSTRARRCRRPTTRPRRSTTEAIRAEPSLRRAARALPGGGRGHGGRSRRSLGAASQGGRRAGRDRRRPDLGDRRRAVPVAPCDPLRDPVPGQRHGPRRRRGVRAVRPGPARSLVGRARLVGQRLDVERACTSTTAPTPTPSRSRPTRTSASATCSATAS